MNNPINGVGRGRGPIATETSSINGAQKPAASQPSKAGNGGADLVSLTNTASSLQQLQKQMASEAPVDAAKVSAIKDALHSQQYEIDAERVAEKFIEVEQALGKV